MSTRTIVLSPEAEETEEQKAAHLTNLIEESAKSYAEGKYTEISTDEELHTFTESILVRTLGSHRLHELVAEAEQDFAEGRYTTLHTKEDINNMMKDIWQRVLGSETS